MSEHETTDLQAGRPARSKKTYAEHAEEAGIPASPVLRNAREAPPNPILNLHVGGQLISELPLEMQGRILYQQTDEGIAENNIGKEPRRVEIVSDRFTKELDHRRDAVKDFGMDLGEAPNSFREAMDKHIRPGMKGRFLSPRVVDRRGMRGWETVLDENGQQVKVGSMFLGQMSAEAAKTRNRQVREHGRRLLGQVTEQYVKEGGSTALIDKD
jgi:hypothetical protein